MLKCYPLIRLFFHKGISRVAAVAVKKQLSKNGMIKNGAVLPQTPPSLVSCLLPATVSIPVGSFQCRTEQVQGTRDTYLPLIKVGCCHEVCQPLIQHSEY